VWRARVVVAVGVVRCAIVVEWGRIVREAVLANIFECHRGNERRWGTVGVEGARSGHLQTRRQ
jgi:hypothetical protein